MTSAALLAACTRAVWTVAQEMGWAMMPTNRWGLNHLRRKSREANMIAKFIKFNVKPGKKEKLLDLMKRGTKVIRNDEPATLRFDVFENSDDDSVVYLYEAYVDQAGLDEHKQSEMFKAFIGGLKDEYVESWQSIMPEGPVGSTLTATATTAE
jgi:autoinducer 2-degrading protein